MALDLSGVRRIVEGLLDDELRLWRDADGRTDDVLDETTGELEPSGADGDVVWEGHGAVLPVGQPALLVPLDGSVARVPTSTAYQAMLPVTAPRANSGDLLTVISSSRDPQLVGRRFRVGDAIVGTFAVVRFVRLQALG
ncbi:DUF6093 family protein [Streptomyces sp. NPDC006984]|uniref:DUF6093 family protein n=1 Tax=Streptomyces sp. NPDC006984 TaxID=3155463 RepID=UPI0034055B51